MTPALFASLAYLLLIGGMALRGPLGTALIVASVVAWLVGTWVIIRDQREGRRFAEAVRREMERP